MITTQPITVAHTIALNLVPAPTDKKIIVWQNNPRYVQDLLGYKGLKIVSFGYIEDLDLTVFAHHLPEVEFPVLDTGDADTIRLRKVLDFQWLAPRYILNIWVCKNINQWVWKGSIPINRVAGYRSLQLRIFDFLTSQVRKALGHNACVGISWEDAGWGYPHGLDRISLEGSAIQEATIHESYAYPVTSTFVTMTTIGITALSIAEDRPLRSSFTVTQLTGTGTVSVKLGLGASSTNRDYVLTNGQSTPINTSYKGVITAVSTNANNRIQVVELLQ